MKTPIPTVLLLIAAAGCSGDGSQASSSSSPPADATAAQPDSTRPAAGTPVRVEPVRRQMMERLVRAPGRTVAIRQARVRAPFAGTLISLQVSDGDRVTRGRRIGSLMSRSSTAALAGAEAMLARAETPEAREDARRALDLARRELIERPLVAGSDGIVTSHAAVAGDVLGEGDEIVTIAASDGIVFEAEVSQIDLPRIRPGQPARVSLVADSVAWSGTVETILPVGSTESLSVPVRIRPDRGGAAGTAGIGLFGHAEIIVGTRTDAAVVPAAAVLRDDVSGSTRIAIVGPDERLHWRDVVTGITRNGRVEIVSPELAAGQSVITSGHIGLADGAPVRSQP